MQAVQKLVKSKPKGVMDDGRGSLVGMHYRTGALAAVAHAIEADLARGQHILLLGARGSGKSSLVRALGSGRWATVALHRDQTARDLLCRRVTEASGASKWADQPVALAARRGDVLVLDGIHRLPPGALVAALGRLAEGALELPQERLQVAKGFRILALAEPGEWLSSEIAALFATHVLPEMTPLELSFALPLLVPSATPELCQEVTAVATAAMMTQKDPNRSQGEKAALRLSLRVLLRFTRQAAASKGDLRELLHESLMSRFLPKRLRETIDGWLEVAGIRPKSSESASRHEFHISY